MNANVKFWTDFSANASASGKDLRERERSSRTFYCPGLVSSTTLVVGEQTGFRIVPFRVSGARTSKFAGHCKCEHAQLSKTIGLSSVCSLHKSTCFGFVSWFFFNVQFFAFTFMFYQLKWEVKFVPSRQFGSPRQV